eukprot:SAG31_NODE_26637_length_439_cov_0.605882_1_plen_76_part_01
MNRPWASQALGMGQRYAEGLTVAYAATDIRLVDRPRPIVVSGRAPALDWPRAVPQLSCVPMICEIEQPRSVWRPGD